MCPFPLKNRPRPQESPYRSSSHVELIQRIRLSYFFLPAHKWESKSDQKWKPAGVVAGIWLTLQAARSGLCERTHSRSAIGAQRGANQRQERLFLWHWFIWEGPAVRLGFAKHVDVIYLGRKKERSCSVHSVHPPKLCLKQQFTLEQPPIVSIYATDLLQHCCQQVQKD